MYYVISAILGGLMVCQGIINKKIYEEWGVTTTVVLNSMLILLVSAVFWLVSLYLPQDTADAIHRQGKSREWSWTFLIPGLIAYPVVAGVPISIEKIGPASTFVLLVVAQVVVSMLWEHVSGERDISAMNILGACLAIGGVILVVK